IWSTGFGAKRFKASNMITTTNIGATMALADVHILSVWRRTVTAPRSRIAASTLVLKKGEGSISSHARALINDVVRAAARSQRRHSMQASQCANIAIRESLSGWPSGWASIALRTCRHLILVVL